MLLDIYKTQTPAKVQLLTNKAWSKGPNLARGENPVLEWFLSDPCKLFLVDSLIAYVILLLFVAMTREQTPEGNPTPPSCNWSSTGSSGAWTYRTRWSEWPVRTVFSRRKSTGPWPTTTTAATSTSTRRPRECCSSASPTTTSAPWPSQVTTGSDPQKWSWSLQSPAVVQLVDWIGSVVNGGYLNCIRLQQQP